MSQKALLRDSSPASNYNSDSWSEINSQPGHTQQGPLDPLKVWNWLRLFVIVLMLFFMFATYLSIAWVTNPQESPQPHNSTLGIRQHGNSLLQNTSSSTLPSGSEEEHHLVTFQDPFQYLVTACVISSVLTVLAAIFWRFSCTVRSISVRTGHPGQTRHSIGCGSVLPELLGFIFFGFLTISNVIHHVLNFFLGVPTPSCTLFYNITFACQAVFSVCFHWNIKWKCFNIYHGFAEINKERSYAVVCMGFLSFLNFLGVTGFSSLHTCSDGRTLGGNLISVTRSVSSVFYFHCIVLNISYLAAQAVREDTNAPIHECPPKRTAEPSRSKLGMCFQIFVFISPVLFYLTVLILVILVAFGYGLFDAVTLPWHSFVSRIWWSFGALAATILLLYTVLPCKYTFSEFVHKSEIKKRPLALLHTLVYVLSGMATVLKTNIDSYSYITSTPGQDEPHPIFEFIMAAVFSLGDCNLILLCLPWMMVRFDPQGVRIITEGMRDWIIPPNVHGRKNGRCICTWLLKILNTISLLALLIGDCISIFANIILESDLFPEFANIDSSYHVLFRVLALEFFVTSSETLAEILYCMWIEHPH